MYLYGASGHGMVIKEILHASGMKVQAFVDDNTEIDSLCSRPVVHDAAGLSPIIVSIEDNSIRKRTYLCQTPLCNFSGNLYSTDIILIQKITEMQAHR